MPKSAYRGRLCCVGLLLVNGIGCAPSQDMVAIEMPKAFFSSRFSAVI
jgi:hypothetical protein